MLVIIKISNPNVCLSFNIEATPTVIPEELYACPGESVTYSCVLWQRVGHRWLVDFTNPSISNVQQTVLESVEQNQTFTVTTNRGDVFSFVVLSLYPFTSMMTTIATTDLNGASVTCEGLTVQKESDTSLFHTITEIAGRYE